jgi:hypothetical protein
MLDEFVTVHSRSGERLLHAELAAAGGGVAQVE